VPLFAVVDEARFQRRFDAGDDTLVDIAFALFPAVSMSMSISF